MKVSTAVAQYVAWRRELGFRFTSDARFFSSFSFHFGDRSVKDLRASQIAKFINSPKSALSTRHTNHGRLTRFLQYLYRRGNLMSVPMPPKPPRYENTFVPYIYSRNEIRRLVSDRVLNGTVRRPLAEPETLRTLLLFLYGTGVALGEALMLTRQNVNFARQTLTVGRHSDTPKRVIPMGNDVRKLLSRYLASTTRAKVWSPYVFVARSGSPLKEHNLRYDFEQLRRAAGVFRLGGPWRQPRMHDLRYTFAVHRITSWYKQGVNVEKMLPALAVYMGHSGMRPIQRYLSLTPEHFRKQVVLIKPQRSRSRK